MPTALLVIGLVVALFVAFRTMSGVTDPLGVGPISIRATNVFRPITVAFAITLALMAIHWRTPAIRALCFLGALGIAALAATAVARAATPVSPVSDGAVIELYTLYAVRGQQLLGPYSQFGWHHPGPAIFYALAPFYLLGGRTTVALNAGAAMLNIAALLCVTHVVWRSRRSAAWLGCFILASTAFYALRVGSMITSAWNPHLLIFPIFALILSSAAAAAGDYLFFAHAAFFASFIVQAHVGLVPAAGAVVVVALALSWYHAHSGAAMTSCRKHMPIAFGVLGVMWVLPLAEQLAYSPGNLTQLARFWLHSELPKQDFHTALAAWSQMLLAVFSSSFEQPYGHLFEPDPTAWSSIAVAQIPALCFVIYRCSRTGDRFLSCLGALCLAVTVAAFGAVLSIRGDIVDHSIFWISAVGAINFAVIVSGTARFSSSRLAPVVVAAVLCLLGVASINAFTTLTQTADASRHPNVQSQAVRSLTRQLVTSLRERGINKPLFVVAGETWKVAAGIFLELYKQRIPFAVTDHLLLIFEQPLRADGSEDAWITIGEPSVHERMSAREGNVVFAQEGEVYIDGLDFSRLDKHGH
jgi:hypothetical protein